MTQEHPKPPGPRQLDFEALLPEHAAELELGRPLQTGRPLPARERTLIPVPRLRTGSLLGSVELVIAKRAIPHRIAIAAML